jgi:predicted ATPase/DNA-binding SARP family transcriptional activator
MMQVLVLGPVEIVGGDGPMRVLPPKQRRLLAALVLRRGETCSVEHLIEAVWDGAAPPSARNVLQIYVSKLRRALPSELRVRTEGLGYVLEFDPRLLDSARFEALLADARAALAAGNLSLAEASLVRALALWRGQAYGELAYADFARVEADRLDELRLLALEEYGEAVLRLGRHAEHLAEAQRLAVDHPERERLQAQLMLALYRSGRQVEALDAYTQARVGLLEERGLDPSAQLRDLQARILRQDPELDAPPVQENSPDPFPAAPNALIGRTRELRDVHELLLRDDVRLLVLTGAGGSGKTRLAIDAARTAAPFFANGAAYVELAGVRDPALVLGTLAHAVGVVDWQAATPTSLGTALRSRELLLVVDNVEHLRAATGDFVELLALAPRLTLLATSRVVLHLSGERVYPVEPLGLDAAISLFVERAGSADPRFVPVAPAAEEVAQVCDRVDRLPLAIELAAARTRALPVGALRARLERRLPLLTGGPRDAPERQRTLEATIAWSYDLLTPDEQTTFARLAVFAGGWTLEAAEDVCDADIDVHQSLVEASLVQREGSRFAMLETVREYAAQRFDELESSDETSRRHLEHYIRVADRFEWRRLAAAPGEYANFRRALRWAATAEEATVCLRLATALGPFFYLVNPIEGRRWLEEALALPALPADATRAKALRQIGTFAGEAGDIDAAVDYLERAADAFGALDDDVERARCLTAHATVLGRQPDRANEARTLLSEALSLYRAHSDADGTAQTLHNLGELELRVGNPKGARQLLERAREQAPDERSLVAILHGLGDVALEEHDYEHAAVGYAATLLTGDVAVDDEALGASLGGLAAVAAARGQRERALILWGAMRAAENRRAVPLDPTLITRYERCLRDILDTSPEDALAAGRSMDSREAVAYALEDQGQDVTGRPLA